jgi:hypothetical protein
VIYNAIVAIFGHELVDDTTSTNPKTTSFQQFASRNDPATIIDHLRSEIEQLSAEKGNTALQLENVFLENRQLRSELERLRNGLEIKRLHEQVNETDRILGELLDTFPDDQHPPLQLSPEQIEYVRLRGKLHRCKDEVERLKLVARNVPLSGKGQDRLLRLARWVAGGNPEFESLLDDQEISVSLVETLVRALVVTIHCQSPVPSETAQDWSTFLTRARDEQILTREGHYLAHIVLQANDVLTHRLPPRNMRTAYVVIALLAAALLWPQLTEG